MSYMRCLCPYTHIEGESEGDYVYSYDDDNKKECISGENMKTETAIDILFSQLSRQDDNLILITCLKAICSNLNIEVRDEPLSFEDFITLQMQIHEKFKEENDDKRM